ncbi:MAG: glycosyltransferase [Actinobacteria bacterium]|nr:glycosyltransferase [Actinomycetota bacterium]
MKKLLMLSYYFPPIGMGGTQRAAKFAKYLPEFGWEPTVVTVKPIAYWAQDPGLLDEIQAVRIIRTESFDPQRLMAKYRPSKKESLGTKSSGGFISTLNEFIIPFFLLPDSKILWKHHALKTVDKLLAYEKFDALYTTSPPHSVQLIGKKLAKTYGLKWVADFRDSWAGGVVVHEPTFYQQWMNRLLQKRVLHSADAIVCVTSEMKNEFDQRAKNVHWIPNGFDPADFPAVEQVEKQKFVFCHCGSITKFSQPEELLRALAELKKKQPQVYKKILFRFVGHDLLGNFPGLVKKFDVQDAVEYHGYKTHREALRDLVHADAFLLIALGKPGDHFIPGKTFEYLGALKPVIAITNVVDTKSLLEKFAHVFILDPESRGAIAETITKIIHLPAQTTKNDVQKFNRKLQTKQLAEILNNLVD